MPCPDFEDRLLDYAELSGGERETVDPHVRSCASCREYLEALLAVDTELTRALGQVRVAPAFRETLVRRVAAGQALDKPSRIPEVLDFLGFAALLAIAVGAILLLVPLTASTMPVIAAAIMVSLVSWAGLRFDSLRN